MYPQRVGRQKFLDIDIHFNDGPRGNVNRRRGRQRGGPRQWNGSNAEGQEIAQTITTQTTGSIPSPPTNNANANANTNANATAHATATAITDANPINNTTTNANNATNSTINTNNTRRRNNQSYRNRQDRGRFVSASFLFFTSFVLFIFFLNRKNNFPFLTNNYMMLN